MPIEGPLRELALPDVVQLIFLSRKTGTLSVRADGHARPALVHFDCGAVVGARPAQETTRLGRLLLMSGKATVAQVEGALTEQRRAPGRRLGALLVETQGVGRREVERQLAFQIEETLFDLVRWPDGYFRFREGPSYDPGPVRVSLSAEALLMEAMRRADEWSELASGDPDTAVVPRLVEGDFDTGTVLHLLPQEWEVLAAIDGERTLRAIAGEVGRAEFEVAKAVFALASGGVVELGKRTSRRTAPRGAGELEAALADLEAGRLEAAERRAAALASAQPRRGDVHLLRGRLAAARGQWPQALEALEEAIRCDPLLPPAYYHLGMAAVRVGDLARAEGALATCVRLPEVRDEHRERAARAVELLRGLRTIVEEAG